MKADTATRRQARRLYGDAIARRGAEWKPLAQRCRDGFENLWITPALDAIEAALREGPDDEPDDSR